MCGFLAVSNQDIPRQRVSVVSCPVRAAAEAGLPWHSRLFVSCLMGGVYFHAPFFLCSFHSAMESHSLLNPNLQQGEGVLSSFRTTWQEFVEDLGFWRVLLLILVIALLSLGIAYYVSGVLPFVDNQPELVH